MAQVLQLNIFGINKVYNFKFNCFSGDNSIEMFVKYFIENI